MKIEVGATVHKYTHDRHTGGDGYRGSEKIAAVNEWDLGRPCFRLESGEAYRTEITEGKGYCNSGNTVFWCNFTAPDEPTVGEIDQ